MKNCKFQTNVGNINIELDEFFYKKIKNVLMIIEDTGKIENTRIDISISKNLYSYELVFSNKRSIFYNIYEAIGAFFESLELCIIEKSPFPIIHCSAIINKGKAFLFCADRNSGKSTLLIEAINKGYTPLTDDFVFLDSINAMGLNLPLKSRMINDNCLKFINCEEEKCLVKVPSLYTVNNCKYEIGAIYIIKYNNNIKGIKVEKLKGKKIIDKMIRQFKKTISPKELYLNLSRISNKIPVYTLEYSSCDYVFNFMENEHE